MPMIPYHPNETHSGHANPQTVTLLSFHIELWDIVLQRREQCNKCIYGLDIEIGLYSITVMYTFWTQANVLPSIMISRMSLNTADLYTAFL